MQTYFAVCKDESLADKFWHSGSVYQCKNGGKCCECKNGAVSERDCTAADCLLLGCKTTAATARNNDNDDDDAGDMIERAASV